MIPDAHTQTYLSRAETAERRERAAVARGVREARRVARAEQTGLRSRLAARLAAQATAGRAARRRAGSAAAPGPAECATC